MMKRNQYLDAKRDYYFVQEGRETVVRVKARDLNGAVIKLAQLWGGPTPSAWWTLEDYHKAEKYLESTGTTLRTIEEIS